MYMYYYIIIMAIFESENSVISIMWFSGPCSVSDSNCVKDSCTSVHYVRLDDLLAGVIFDDFFEKLKFGGF